MGYLFLGTATFISTLWWLLAKPNLHIMALVPWLSLSQYLAVIGATLLAFNFVLAVRSRWVEDRFGGLDKVYKAHHLTGALATIFLINHPIMLALNIMPLYKVALLYFIPNVSQLAYASGILSLYIMIVLLLLTLYVKLPYPLWLKTHKLMGVPLLLGALHMVLITSDISRYLPLRLWLLGLMGIALMAYLYKLVLYRFLGPKRNYRVTDVVTNGPFTMLGMVPQNKSLQFRAGQFAFLSLHNRVIGREAHPYSFASAQHEPTLYFVVKSLGDYTRKLPEAKVGDKVTLFGPYGRLGDKMLMSDRRCIWICGGVGITPFLSLMHSVRHDQQVDWFYSVNKRPEAVFETAINQAISGQPNLRYHLHVAQENGFLTAAKVMQQTGQVERDTLVMLCGPLPMMEAFKKQFMALGCKSRQIIYEDFSLL